ncbi:histone-lysine N-methyltransferase SETMAR [Plakobranchus ocellatus]|uniref:Histone-lysine N-methyltransferase SETMAR n=1 Tax=Plakobranchus ocellatus TaxID=259542 RepID=A0AAV4A8G3_9GAST|nr:histone-lysine N-methyltransferase SETMAR [Plakobranchus ocellatus]
MTWKHPSSPFTKKFKVQRSAAKVMATVSWDAKGVILLDILPQGQCINAARYCSTPLAVKMEQNHNLNEIISIELHKQITALLHLFQII